MAGQELWLVGNILRSSKLKNIRFFFFLNLDSFEHFTQFINNDRILQREEVTSLGEIFLLQNLLKQSVHDTDSDSVTFSEKYLILLIDEIKMLECIFVINILTKSI